MNSVLLAYKNRPTHLRPFLQALDAAAATATSGVELLVMDTSDYDSDDCFDVPLSHLLVRWEYNPADPLFHKAKYLNAAADETTGDLLTVLDVDVLVQPNFFTSIEAFFADPLYQGTNHKLQSSAKKLGHRVRLLDAIQTDRIHRFGISHFQYLLANPDLYRFNTAAETYQDTLTGCGLYTISKADFHRVGGYDERFVGYGLEDTDFNLRAEKNGIKTKMNDASEAYHLKHDRESSWADPAAEEANRRLFHKNIADGHPMPVRPAPAAEPQGECGCHRSKG